MGEVELRLLRPEAPEDLIDEQAFARDEFLPYWAELWPAALALAEALPERLGGVRVVELGCGLGVPSLVAAARGAVVTATDWAGEALDLLRRNAARNGLELRAETRDWREPWQERFDLALAADVLYERRNVEPLAALLPALAPQTLLGLAGRPYESELLARLETEPVAERVVRVRGTGPGTRLAETPPRRRCVPPVTYNPSMLGGLLTAIVTPFREDGSVDFDAFQELARHLVAHGSDGVVVAGTTGESPTLTDAERLDLVRAAVEAIGDGATVVAGTGTYSTAHSVHLTERAHELGADGFLVVTPYYSKPPQRGIVAHFAAIAEASDRPIVAYNIPSRVVVDIEPETISRLAEIPTVKAVKQAHPDRDEARHIVETGLDLYAGDDNLIAPFLELGGTGGISVHAHVVGPQVAEQIAAARAGDLDRVRELDRALAPAYELLQVTVNPIPIKAALRLLGHRVGGYRLPLVEPTPDELDRVRDCLERLGLLVHA
ncbi:MAG TPA: 4-hydroxy-tetrahydrodipicolinate synthase [Gaiellaceae bacterium]